MNATESNRQVFPDSLRALALLGVLMVNAVSYPSAPWGTLLGDHGASGGVALALQGLYAFAVQGKAYPLLVLLFGMGLVWAQRGLPPSQARDKARRRQQWLLLLGVFHGVFIYFGDILTMYALVGWTLLKHVRMPWRQLRRHMRRAVVWAACVLLVALLLNLVFGSGRPDSGNTPVPTLAAVTSWPAFWSLNAMGYGFLQLSTLVVGFPLLRLLMMVGIAAARLRWLTHRRWRNQRRRLLRLGAWPAVVFNAVYALAHMHFAGHPHEQNLLEFVSFFLIGPWLSAIIVTALAEHASRAPWLLALAPLGRRTLSLYIGHGALCVLLFSGVGLSMQPHLAGMLGFSVLLWAASLRMARASGQRHWPMEALMAKLVRR